MTYNVNDPADLEALQSEIIIDAEGMGYALVPYTDTKKLEKFINDVVNNVTPQSAGPEFTHEVLMQTWEPKGAENGSVPWIEALTREDDPRAYEAKYRVNCGSDSLNNLNGIIVQLSRPEVMFGQGTFLSKTDLTSAINFEG